PPESQQPAPAPAAAPAPAQTPPADAGHKSLFKNLRFEEDWSALKEAETKTDHWLPGIKAIELDGEGDWSIGFGGQIRLQSKSEQNRNLLGGPVPHNNDFNLLRVREYADIRYRKDFRAFIEMISAGIHGNDAAPTPIDRQDWDMLNGFVELLGDDTLGRLGRFEMQYGAQRLISPLEWANTRRTFQGGLFRAKAGASTTDVFVTRPVVVDPHQNDDESHERWFSGVYNVWKVGESTNLDLYALALNDQDPTAPVTVPAGGPPTFDGDVYTAGGRYSGKLGAADYDFEAAKQFGNRNGLDVDAYMWTAVGGFTLADVLFSPRFAVDVDYASGDDSAGDGDYETFNQLYPLGHAYFGYIDLIGRQNIVQVMPSMTLKTTSTTTFRASWSDFELASESDFLYNSAGGIAAGQSAATLDTGDEVGQEVDLTVAWKPASLAPHSEFLFGYSWFDPGSFVNGWGDGEDANLLYAQYTFTF
ncbi:MAG TPA: alginate export family protein, partial [Planctomycetota bacterium]|nr:alginate export family protein [Planctomycetota bacterium]